MLPGVQVLFAFLLVDKFSMFSLAAAIDTVRSANRLLGRDYYAWTTISPDGEAVMAATKAQGMEGVVAKRRDSRYEPGRRSDCWVKVKHVRRTSAVVVGWKPGEGGRAGRVGSLLLAVPEGDGWKMTEKGATALDGELPVNMSGGVLSTNPIGASGMLRFAEAAMQVRGQAGEHQVDGARTALGHAYGGGANYFAMWIVSSEPAPTF